MHVPSAIYSVDANDDNYTSNIFSPSANDAVAFAIGVSRSKGRKTDKRHEELEKKNESTIQLIECILDLRINRDDANEMSEFRRILGSYRRKVKVFY